MSRRMLLNVGAVVFGLAYASAASAEPTCKQPSSSEWIRPAPAKGDRLTVSSSLVHPVTRDLVRATELLKSRSSIPLARRDLARFIDPDGASAPHPTAGGRPYLVRAVFPTPNPSLELNWNGRRLEVLATGLGCFAFAKHPLIVFLDQAPDGVSVMAMSAL